MQEFLLKLAPHLWSLAALIATTVVLPALHAFISEKAKTSKLFGVLARVEHVVESTVAEVNATMKAEFEAASADGVITPEEAKQLKEHALSLTMKALSDKGVSELGSAMGLAGPAIESFLRGLIEKKVVLAQAQAAASDAPVAPRPQLP